MAELPKLKKSLGQHFLTNPGIARKIVDLLDPEEEEEILEIGPGGGSLTELLRSAPHSRLQVIEKDTYWAAFHAAKGIEVIACDALEFDWSGLRGQWKLIGNLPYNIASPLIWNIVSQCDCYERAVFMTQKEVAERICARPDTRNYGALSVWVQAYAEASLALRVSPGSFRPPPKVDSAVIKLTPKREMPPYPEYLRRLLKICFQQRRKQLVGIFRRARLPLLEQALANLDIDPQARPENLRCEQFLGIARFWAQAREDAN